MQLIIPVIFGLESLVKQELTDMGYQANQIDAINGQVILDVPEDEISLAVAKCNINLRTAERVLIKIGGGVAKTFDELFDLTYKMDWGKYIPENWAFHVNGYSRKSNLFGIPACQSIVKKSIVKKLLSSKTNNKGLELIEDDLLGILKI